MKRARVFGSWKSCETSSGPGLLRVQLGSCSSAIAAAACSSGGSAAMRATDSVVQLDPDQTARKASASPGVEVRAEPKVVSAS